MNNRTIMMLGTAAVGLFGTGALALPQFVDWSPPINLASLPGSSGAISTPAVDGCVSWARDGLSLYFTSNRPRANGASDFDIYVATRPSRDVGFGAVTRLPAPINRDGSDEFCPTVATGNRLYFSSTKVDPLGDIYVTQRRPGGWTEPEHLGPNINGPGIDETPTFYEDDEGRTVMIYSRRPTTVASGFILMSIDGGPAVLLPGAVNVAGANNRPTVTRDGKTLYFDTTRFTAPNNVDLAVATRTSLSQPFDNVVHLSALSGPGFDARPALSFDGRTLAFSSVRAGNPSPAPDIWITSRDKAHGN
ncbi:MAG: hypothetical protein HKO13_04555 [Sphingomonas sp.]|nr:hypothetical protein [Sphingomonas sp.]RZV51902.1 MAG: hypothetical protein EX258_03000 [Sphingomonadaceae bacterium]